MIKFIFTTILLTFSLFAYDADISPITQKIKQQMIKGSSYKKGCPVPLKNLRYLRLPYKDFRGKTKIGEMIVNKSVAYEVVEIFEKLYNIGYPIRKMRLVSKYGANDWQSIESDNTSAFNCRRATGKKTWSKHSYGKAIDINPIENPYISARGYISHKASYKYKRRVHKNRTYGDRAVLLKNDKATKIFKKYGWRWGGDWSRVKDYQHFYK